MLMIMRRFEWTWFGLLYRDDDFGQDAYRIFRSELAQSGWGCMAYAEPIPLDNDVAGMQRLVSLMKTSTARVVAVVENGIRAIKLMDEVGVMNDPCSFRNHNQSEMNCIEVKTSFCRPI